MKADTAWVGNGECFLVELRRLFSNCERAVATKTQVVSTSEIQGAPCRWFSFPEPDLEFNLLLIAVHVSLMHYTC